MKDTWVPGSHRILKHKHPPGFSHWQLCLSHFLRALGSDAVGDLQNATWPWRLEFLVWRVSIGLDRFLISTLISKKTKHEWNLQMVSWLPRSFSQLLFARTSKSPDLLAKDDRRLCWAGAGRGWRIWKQSINMKQLLIDFFQRDFLFKHV